MKRSSFVTCIPKVAIVLIILSTSVALAGDDPADVSPGGTVNTTATSTMDTNSWITVQYIGGWPGMDIYTDADFGWTHTFDTTGKAIFSAELRISAWDVDYSSGERDRVDADGTTLGYLRGSPSSWSITTFNIEPTDAAAMLADGEIDIDLDIDEFNGGWLVEIDYSRLSIHWDWLPVADAGPDQVVEQDSHAGASVMLDGSGSYKPSSADPLIYMWTWPGGSAMGVTPTVVLPLGTTTVTLTVSDGLLSDTDTVDITVVDTIPPVITSISASPDTLWSPNHKMVDVTITTTCVDICDPHPVCRIVGVTSNEPEDAHGDGDTEPDWQITGDLILKLRAERAGGGNDRVYTIEVECTDRSGNKTTATVEVTVTHDQGK